MKIISRIIVITLLAIGLIGSGCAVVGLFGKPTSHEKKIPAEFDLKTYPVDKLMVFINQPSWLSNPANINSALTEAIYDKLLTKRIITKDHLVPLEQLKELQTSYTNYSYLSPEQIAETLNAQLLLYILIDDYQLQKLPNSNYYKGLLTARAQLFDLKEQRVLWPDNSEGRKISVGFEIERNGYDPAIQRLARAFAHCLIRYFYNCPVDEFKIFDEQNEPTWRQLDI